MCGIVGAIESNGRVDRHGLQVLNDSMRARGPDGVGFYHSPCGRVGLAMRRLSIIDLEGGWQPLFTEDRRVAAMQNGEIYNHRELRRQLEQLGYRFRTDSDTEVLAHGYDAWGIRGLLERLDGMYALAIADERRRQLHLARDRFGEKPLYYHAAPGRFVYSSQLLTAAAYPGLSREWDAEGLHWYLALHFVPGDTTVFRRIRKLRPGHFLTVDWDSAAVREECYWRLEEQRETGRTPDELLDLLDAATRSRLLADVPVGLFLSGGLDSSVLAALAVRHAPRLATFSMGFAAATHDERPFARQVADYLGTEHRHFEFGDDAFQTLLPQVVAAMDEPVGDQAMLPLYWLCREAAREVKVVLSGEGADELFAGYEYYAPAAGRAPLTWRQRLKRWRRRREPLALLQTGGTTPSGFPLLTNERERHEWLGPSIIRGWWYDDLLAGWAATRDSIRRACLADVDTWLAEDLFMKLDKMAMAHSLEGRAPYLYPPLARAAFDLPASQKIARGGNKLLLRLVARRLLPATICERRKQGFCLPMRRWLADFLKRESPDDLIAAAHLGVEPGPLMNYLESEAGGGVTRERLTYALLVLAKWAAHAHGRIAEIRAEQSRQSVAA